jgi:hypothetical protein
MKSADTERRTVALGARATPETDTRAKDTDLTEKHAGQQARRKTPPVES